MVLVNYKNMLDQNKINHFNQLYEKRIVILKLLSYNTSVNRFEQLIKKLRKVDRKISNLQKENDQYSRR